MQFGRGRFHSSFLRIICENKYFFAAIKSRFNLLEFLEPEMEDIQPIQSFEDPLTKEVFENALVWNILRGYLGPGDLKDCRLICKTFDCRVVDCKRWKEGDFWTLHLKEDNWSDLEGLSSLEVGPSSVKVTLSGCGPKETEALDKLPKIFKDMKSLEVDFKEKAETKGKKEEYFNTERLRTGLKELGVWVSASLAVLLAHSSPQLKTLTLRKEVLSLLAFTRNPALFNSDSKALQRLKGLKTFNISNYTQLPFGFLMAAEQSNPVMNRLASNLDSLEELNLKIGEKGDYFPQNDLKTLLERRAPFMRKLELGEIDVVKRFSDLVFPNLTHLSLRISDKGNWGHVDELCPFLSKQPFNLQGLTLKVQGYLTKELLQVVEEKSGNLSSLSLKFWLLQQGVDWDWEWLGRCDKLRSFSLTTPTYNQGAVRNGVSLEVEDVLLSLPKGMRKISLRSGFMGPLTTRFELEEVLKDPKFKDLEELSILLVDWAVRDPVLEVLGSRGRFPRLKKLHLSHTYHYSGDLKGDKDFWQGLEDLCFRKVSCVLSEESLLEKLGGSQNLRRLTIRNKEDEPTFPPSALESIVEGSKALETLALPSERYSARGEGDLALAPIKPRRLKKIKRLHPRSADETWDSDSDADMRNAPDRDVFEPPHGPHNEDLHLMRW